MQDSEDVVNLVEEGSTVVTNGKRKSDFITEYSLKQQTPMIHFQHDEEGATLRASEVKPKLDRFLITKLGDEGGYGKGLAIAKKNGWLLGEHNALNYRLQFLAPGTPEKSDTINAKVESLSSKQNQVRPTRPICSSYFGNMVEKGAGTLEEKTKRITNGYKETVKYVDEIRLKLVCFDNALKESIEKCIIAFFLLNNFGTRQNKGFGSFKIVKKNGMPIRYDIDETIKESFGRTFYKVPSRRPMDDAADIYRLMKSGINQRDVYFRAFIYRYMHALNIGNEKAWMKQQGIAPTTGKDSNSKKHEQYQKAPANCKFNYVRAVLGVGDNVSYINKVDANGRPDWGKGKTTVSISHNLNDKDPEKIQRFSSPILFKIIGQCIYILPSNVNPEVFGKEFQFATGRKADTITTPEQFDMDDFMLAFKNYLDEKETRDKLYKADHGIIGFRGTLTRIDPQRQVNANAN